MTLDEVESRALFCLDDQWSNYHDIARAVLLLLPVVRAAEAWLNIAPYSEQAHRDKHAAYCALFLAIDTLRRSLTPGTGGE